MQKGSLDFQIKCHERCGFVKEIEVVAVGDDDE